MVIAVQGRSEEEQQLVVGGAGWSDLSSSPLFAFARSSPLLCIEWRAFASLAGCRGAAPRTFENGEEGWEQRRNLSAPLLLLPSLLTITITTSVLNIVGSWILVSDDNCGHHIRSVLSFFCDKDFTTASLIPDIDIICTT
uniref:Uncharacterized protein n=1 Tax=Ditylenchus dipsaci TaxID=166011 RepID=A0A915DTG2_9BILA